MSHLQFYKQHGISPVNYDLSDFGAHLERRDSLYKSLGVLTLAFRDASVLEVAAGTGQNSLYIASLRPKNLTLLEPNPVAIEKIKQVYREFSDYVCAPTIVEQMLENYIPPDTFDIVVCENWLGASEHERQLLVKLGSMVAADGILVLTVVTPVGLISNLIRRALSVKLSNPNDEFEDRTTILSNAFDAHLKTISSMTRNTKDWVQDNMINPAYFGLSLTLPMVFRELENEFDIIESNPKYRQDWRWFKSMFGKNKQLNEQFLEEYIKNNHNFIDYRFIHTENYELDNKLLETTSSRLNDLVCAFEKSYLNKSNPLEPAREIITLIDELIEQCGKMPKEILQSLKEATSLLKKDTLLVEDVSNMDYFSKMFGRETMYISLQKTR